MWLDELDQLLLYNVNVLVEAVVPHFVVDRRP